MKAEFSTPKEYLDSLPEDRKKAITKLRKVVKDNLPEGFKEVISYGMLGYVVPHSVYPNGYHANPKLPLPFINIGSQKNYITFHHIGMYADAKLTKWFTDEYPKHCKSKLDMGKGCIRFKKPDEIPFDLISELVSKISVKDWIEKYEKQLKKK